MIGMIYNNTMPAKRALTRKQKRQAQKQARKVTKQVHAHKGRSKMVDPKILQEGQECDLPAEQTFAGAVAAAALDDIAAQAAAEAPAEDPGLELRDVCLRPVSNAVNLITVNLLDDLMSLLTEREGDLTRVVLTTVVSRLLTHDGTLGTTDTGRALFSAIQDLDYAFRNFIEAAEGIVDLEPGKSHIKYT